LAEAGFRHGDLIGRMFIATTHLPRRGQRRRFSNAHNL